MNHPETPLKETITMYFGERHFDTLKEFDSLKKSLRRSRTGTLDYLLKYHNLNEKKMRKKVKIVNSAHGGE